MKKSPFIAITTALALAGCAQNPALDSSESEAGNHDLTVQEGISFSVSGETTAPGECFVRYAIGYPENPGPVELSLGLESEMKREDGDWMEISWTEGILEQIPSPEAVGQPNGGGVMHYFEMTELLLACDQMRTRVIVNGCDPAPCPPLTIDDRDNLFPLLLEDRSQDPGAR